MHTYTMVTSANGYPKLRLGPFLRARIGAFTLVRTDDPPPHICLTH